MQIKLPNYVTCKFYDDLTTCINCMRTWLAWHKRRIRKFVNNKLFSMYSSILEIINLLLTNLFSKAKVTFTIMPRFFSSSYCWYASCIPNSVMNCHYFYFLYQSLILKANISIF